MVLQLIIVGAIFVTALSCHQVQGDRFESQNSQFKCPPWYYHSSSDDSCRFSDKTPHVVKKYKNTSELKLGYCITAIPSSNNTVLVYCPYILSPNYNQSLIQIDTMYQILPEDMNNLDEVVCGKFNRMGYLCSQCKENHGIAAYSYYGLVCVECTHTAWRYIAFILFYFGPTTVLFFVFLLFNINVHSGNLTGFIFFSHVIVLNISFLPPLIMIPQLIYGHWSIQVVLALYGAWSLNSLTFLVPPLCISPNLTTLQAVSLGYIPALYILILCAVVYNLIEYHDRGIPILVKAWRPLSRLVKKFKRPTGARYSVIYTFGTLMLLSYGKNLYISFTLLQGVFPKQLNTSTNSLSILQLRSVDLSKEYFGSAHALYAVIGIVGGLVTVIFPLILALIFPTRLFPVLISCCGSRRWHGLRTFMEVFTSTFKDKTNYTRDYRFTTFVFLLGRVLVCLNEIVLGGHVGPTSWILGASIFAIAAVGFAYFKPHRRDVHNAIDSLLLLLLAKLSLCLYLIFETPVTQKQYQVIVLLILIDLAVPQVILVAYFTYKFLSWVIAQDFKRLIKTLRMIRGDPSYQPLITN